MRCVVVVTDRVCRLAASHPHRRLVGILCYELLAVGMADVWVDAPSLDLPSLQAVAMASQWSNCMLGAEPGEGQAFADIRQ